MIVQEEDLVTEAVTELEHEGLDSHRGQGRKHRAKALVKAWGSCTWNQPDSGGNIGNHVWRLSDSRLGGLITTS